MQCTSRLVSGKVSLTTKTRNHAAISCGGIRYAVGERTQLDGRIQLLPHDLPR